MRKYDSVIFDVDGTLLDTTAGITASVRDTIEEMRLPPLSPEKLMTFIGPPVQESFAREYGMNAVDAQAAAEIFRKRYKGEHLLEAEPYAGIMEALGSEKRAGSRLGIATYKRADYAVEIVNHFGFGALCESINGADNENKLRKKDIIGLTMKEMGISDPHRVIYVGDTLSDAQSAQSIGIDFMAVTYGFGFKPGTGVSDVRCVSVVDDPAGIAAFFDGDAA